MFRKKLVPEKFGLHTELCRVLPFFPMPSLRTNVFSHPKYAVSSKLGPELGSEPSTPPEPCKLIEFRMDQSNR